MHATWNILLKTAGDPLRTATVGMVAAFSVLLPGVAVGWAALGQPPIPPQALVVGTLSGFAEIAYFVFLAAAYRRGDLLDKRRELMRKWADYIIDVAPQAA